ncbi:MAG: hypothetical protein EOP06_10405 [Proteobacteria bacterium]|nr:MAG: hypothetical protein EOP06_10405 [Pseudomonadota bacterium]
MKFLMALVLTFAAGITPAFAKWVDADKEAQRLHQVKAWRAVDFRFTQYPSNSGTSLNYLHAVNDLWRWQAGLGIDSLGYFITGGADFYLRNAPQATCFFFLNCHEQITAGGIVQYASGGRKTYNNANAETKYDQTSSLSVGPQLGYRAIFQQVFSVALDLGYRSMLQKPSVNRGFGVEIPSAREEMEKGNKDGMVTSFSVGVVF